MASAGVEEMASRLSTIQEEIADMASRLMAIKEEYQRTVQERDRLAEVARKTTDELASAKREVATLQGMAEDTRRAMPDVQGDDMLCLDVGGRNFKMYRSTLAQYEDSVLAHVVSKPWPEGARNADGTVFLDMSPDGFEEVSNFLRSRRVDPQARSNFSAKAVGVASYLGIPVDHVSGSQSHVAKFACVGHGAGYGLAFGMSLPHPSCGMAHGLELSLLRPAACAVYVKAGDFEDSLAKPEDWRKAWAGELEAGWNSVPLNLHLRNGEAHSIYLWCTAQAIQYSTEAPAAQSGTPLTLTSGRAFVKLFEWPVQGEHAGLNTQHRHFAGHVRYSHYTAASSVHAS